MMARPHMAIIPTPEQGGTGSRGLQILDTIAKNELILCTHPRQTKIICIEDWEEYCSARQLPDDAGIWIERLQFVVTDWHHIKPTWSYLNHGRGQTCNLKMVFDEKSCVLKWYAKRKIVSGEQLRFDYGIVPSVW